MDALKGDGCTVFPVFGEKQPAESIFVVLLPVMYLLESFDASIILPVQILI